MNSIVIVAAVQVGLAMFMDFMAAVK